MMSVVISPNRSSSTRSGGARRVCQGFTQMPQGSQSECYSRIPAEILREIP